MVEKETGKVIRSLKAKNGDHEYVQHYTTVMKGKRWANSVHNPQAYTYSFVLGESDYRIFKNRAQKRGWVIDERKVTTNELTVRLNKVSTRISYVSDQANTIGILAKKLDPAEEGFRNLLIHTIAAHQTSLKIQAELSSIREASKLFATKKTTTNEAFLEMLHIELDKLKPLAQALVDKIADLRGQISSAIREGALQRIWSLDHYLEELKRSFPILQRISVVDNETIEISIGGALVTLSTDYYRVTGDVSNLVQASVSKVSTVKEHRGRLTAIKRRAKRRRKGTEKE